MSVRILQSKILNERYSGGFTLIEVMIAAVAAGAIAAGTMVAFSTAGRIVNKENIAPVAEAQNLAVETLEELRNHIAADSTTFPPALDIWLPTPGGLPLAATSDSILNLGVKRCYRVTEEDCDGDGAIGDCYAVSVRVCWNDLSACSLPPPNSC